MGCDIHGHVEIRMYPDSSRDWWLSVLNVGALADRNYDLFGFLFGVRNYARFEPIAPFRGLPKNPSDTIKKEIDEWKNDAHSTSYLTLTELQSINWDDESPEEDQRVHVYHEDNHEMSYKAMSSGDINFDVIKKFGTDNVLVKDGTTYKIEKIKNNDLIGPSWQSIFDCMEVFGKTFGVENVRMVVYFDN